MARRSITRTGAPASQSSSATDLSVTLYAANALCGKVWLDGGESYSMQVMRASYTGVSYGIESISDTDFPLDLKVFSVLTLSKRLVYDQIVPFGASALLAS